MDALVGHGRRDRSHVYCRASSTTTIYVAEVFLTAGHAFQKLGDLTMQLHMGPSSLPTEEKWSENHVDHLREALTRFAHELDQISNNVQARTTKMISTDIRRRHMAPQRSPVASAVSTLKRQPMKLGPVVVPKRLNVARNQRVCHSYFEYLQY
ncbi:unnamed protein product [Angiostrongylus costaricensis]|uniref:Uncharacterized protein n=1 Tax=Angiostrongylus costaricensis TaxID=334426 RepID=A0A0R3Q1E9_ANGCS|nr:unnamed protein product [Angiostrongylus costaricensis]